MRLALFLMAVGVFGQTVTPGGGSSGGSGTVTSVTCGTGLSGGTITGTGTCAVIGGAGEILAGATPALTYTPVLGVASSNTGSLGLRNASNAFTFTLAPATGMTASNTMTGPAAVPTNGNLLDCTTTSTTCVLTDSGVVAANVVNASSPGAGIAHFAGATQTVTSSAVSLTADVSGVLPLANGGTGTSTPALVAGTNVTITGSFPNQTINASGGGGTVEPVLTTNTAISCAATNGLIYQSNGSSLTHTLPATPCTMPWSIAIRNNIGAITVLTISPNSNNINRASTNLSCGSATANLCLYPGQSAVISSDTNSGGGYLVDTPSLAGTFSSAVSAPSFTGTGSNPYINLPTNGSHTGAAGDLWNNSGLLEGYFSGASAPFPQGPASTTSGHLVLWNASNGGLLSDAGANPIGNSQLAVVQTRRSCTIDNDTQSATVLTAAQFSGHCVIPAAATIVEVDVSGGTQTLTGTATAPTFTGTSSIQIGKHGATNSTALLSAALASASGVACALTTTSGTCIFDNGLTSSSSVTISTTSLAAGDELYVSAATADGTQTWYNVAIVYTIN